ncbi:hypothetical protein [Zongyangia hominis]|uniref:Uncharacterized protein n=1 Tax=Zongyangia hominis TaxID=2763677 RepID=A0A926EBU7_9FIRM|nr:hypothetical protein [Zongyangia hominis]MBC8569494.1 hypothetical protein [Zongyangia hominis]
MIIKTFQTPGAKYVYDRHANVLCRVTPEEYEQLRQVERGELDPEESAAIAKYRATSGMFAPNAVMGMRHPSTDILEHLANYRMGQLTLQVTQQCNLRCGCAEKKYQVIEDFYETCVLREFGYVEAQ